MVENRPGGDGLVAINAFVSANDDHVLLYASSASFIAHPYTQEKMPYDLNRDLLPIARVSDTILSVGVPASSGIKTIADFVAAAKKEPDKHNAAGAAGLPEFAVMAFIKSENLGITKVPYKDVVQAGRDLAENRIQFLLSSLGVVQPLVAGRQGPRRRGRRPAAHAAGAGRADRDRGGLSGARRWRPRRASTGRRSCRSSCGSGSAARWSRWRASRPSRSASSSSGQDMTAEGPEGLAQALVDQARRAAEIAKILG